MVKILFLIFIALFILDGMINRKIKKGFWHKIKMMMVAFGLKCHSVRNVKQIKIKRMPKKVMKNVLKHLQFTIKITMLIKL
uniref:Uncharacterized protein n=1 Tax=Meloidogyne enterolobii TaxID=390850 RepID=A0A6V7X2G3_MELEN|nr:unnamed protein product [Meloidogyne enterolobii]